MRGLANVRAEFSLTALAYNLRRALNILGHDGRGSRLRRVTRLYRHALGSWAPLRSRQAADEAQTLRFPHRSLFALLHPEFREFSHGLQELRRSVFCSETWDL